MKRTDVQPGPVKRVPLRTCVACRQVKAKRELVRIVKTEGGITVDLHGKKSGRGAYLCKAKKCWDIGLKGNRLDHVMHGKITPQDQQQLEEYAKQFQQE